MKLRKLIFPFVTIVMAAVIIFAVVGGVILSADYKEELEVSEKSSTVAEKGYLAQGSMQIVELDVSAAPVSSLSPSPTPTPAPTPTLAPTPTPDPSLDYEPGCILTDASTIRLTTEFSDVPESDDGMLYVYQMAPYEYDINGANVRKVAETEARVRPSVAFTMTAREIPGLYCKYVYASVKDGVLTMNDTYQGVGVTT